MEQLREVEGVSAALTKQMKHIPHRILLTSLISLQIVSLDEANCTCVWISWRGSGLLCDTLCALDRTDSVSVATLAGDKILMERQTGIQSNRITDSGYSCWKDTVIITSSTSSNPLIEIMSEKDKNWGKKADLPTGSRSWSKGIHDYAPGHLHITPTGAAQPCHQVIRASATSEHLVCNKSTYSSFHPSPSAYPYLLTRKSPF